MTRKLEDHPSDLEKLRNLIAKRLGLPTEPPQVTLWQRIARWWRSHG